MLHSQHGTEVLNNLIYSLGVLKHTPTPEIKDKMSVRTGTEVSYQHQQVPGSQHSVEFFTDAHTGRDWGQEEKWMTEDEMAGWHH